MMHCFGDQYPPRDNVFKWFRQLMSGARTLEDDDRYSRMATSVAPENVSRVESMVKKASKVTYAEIQDIMKISSGSLMWPRISVNVRVLRRDRDGTKL